MTAGAGQSRLALEDVIVAAPASAEGIPAAILRAKYRIAV